MATRRSAADAPIVSQAGDRGGFFVWPVASLLLIAGAVIVATQLPAPLIPLVTSIFMVTAGLAIAGGCYLAGSRIGQGSSIAWEIAGALVFLGFAAAMLADDARTLSLLAQMEAQLMALAR
jgi:hypothetical protein